MAYKADIEIAQENETKDIKEIAEKLGISVITVDSHLMKAHADFKEKLKKYSLLLLLYCLS